MICVSVCASLALAAAPGDPEDVVIPLADGVSVNWTLGMLEAERTGTAAGVGSTRRALEQQVRTDLGPAILDGARRVRVAVGQTVADLVGAEEFGVQTRSRLSRWAVSETRYYASGRVDLVGRLSLQDLLKPYVLTKALPSDEVEAARGGVVIDARGADLVPSYAPRIVDAAGAVLFDGNLYEDVATDSLVAVFVGDPAHPAAAARAGDSPVILVADDAQQTDVVLGVEAARSFLAQDGPDLARTGGLVLVVD